MYNTVYKRRRRTELLVYAARWQWQKQLQEDGHGGEAATVSNIGAEVGSIPLYATLILSGPKKLFGQSFKVVSLSNYIAMSNGLCKSWRVAVWNGISWALSKSILTEDLVWSWLQMAQWPDRLSAFQLGEPLKFPLNIFYIQNHFITHGT